MNVPRGTLNANGFWRDFRGAVCGELWWFSGFRMSSKLDMPLE